MARPTTSDGVDPDLLRRLGEFQRRVRQVTGPRRIEAVVPARAPLSGPHADIMSRLRRHSRDLADSLEQALIDLNDGSRLTYVGPAGEAREVMRATIQLFAPDEEIKKQPWFEGVKQGNQTNASQAERLRFVVQSRGGDHRQAAEAVDMIDARIGRLGRNVYQRASAALHADNQRQEVRKLIGWVFAVLDEVLPE